MIEAVVSYHQILNKVRPMRYRIFVILFTAAAACAQQPSASSGPAFETASIHPVRVTPGCFSMLPPGGSSTPSPA